MIKCGDCGGKQIINTNQLFSTIMNQQKKFLIIALAIGAIATFLPWLNAPFIGSINGSAGDGWFSFGMLGIAIILLAYNKRGDAITVDQLWATRLLAALSLLLGIWKIIDISSTVIFDQKAGMGVVGSGLYLLVLASLVALLLTVPGIYQKISKTPNF